MARRRGRRRNSRRTGPRGRVSERRVWLAGLSARRRRSPALARPARRSPFRARPGSALQPNTAWPQPVDPLFAAFPCAHLRRRLSTPLSDLRKRAPARPDLNRKALPASMNASLATLAPLQFFCRLTRTRRQSARVNCWSLTNTLQHFCHTRTHTHGETSGNRNSASVFERVADPFSYIIIFIYNIYIYVYNRIECCALACHFRRLSLTRTSVNLMRNNSRNWVSLGYFSSLYFLMAFHLLMFLRHKREACGERQVYGARTTSRMCSSVVLSWIFIA